MIMMRINVRLLMNVVKLHHFYNAFHISGAIITSMINFLSLSIFLLGRIGSLLALLTLGHSAGGSGYPLFVCQRW